MSPASLREKMGLCSLFNMSYSTDVIVDVSTYKTLSFGGKYLQMRAEILFNGYFS